MGHDGRRVVPVRPKISPGRRVITAYEISLDARRAELKGAMDHRQQPALQQLPRPPTCRFVRDMPVEPFPEFGVELLYHLTVVLDRANFTPARGFIEIDE